MLDDFEDRLWVVIMAAMIVVVCGFSLWAGIAGQEQRDKEKFQTASEALSRQRDIENLRKENQMQSEQISQLREQVGWGQKMIEIDRELLTRIPKNDRTNN